tara:strand:+ start:146 stop:364 length:219 start_codon:yes stop_codon:yes gene_type:complete
LKVGDLVKKVIIWRCISIFVTLLVMFIATGDVKSATGITLALHILLVVCHYAFEKFWEKFHKSRWNVSYGEN